jgi:hypothetical protein
MNGMQNGSCHHQTDNADAVRNLNFNPKNKHFG